MTKLGVFEAVLLVSALGTVRVQGQFSTLTRVGAWDIGMTPHQIAESLRTNAQINQIYLSDDLAHYTRQAVFSDEECRPDTRAPVIVDIFNNWQDGYRYTPGQILGGLSKSPNWLKVGSVHLRFAVQTSLRIEPSLAVVLAEAEVRLTPCTWANDYAYSLARLVEAYRRADETNLLWQLATKPAQFHIPTRPTNRWIKALGLAYQPTDTVEQVVHNLHTAVFLGDLIRAREALAALPDTVGNRWAMEQVVAHLGEGLAEKLPDATKPLVTSIVAGLPGELKNGHLPLEKRMASFSDERCLKLFKLANDIYGHMDTRTIDQFLYLVENRAGPGYLNSTNWPRPQNMVYMAINATRIYGGLRALPLYPVIQCRGMNPPADQPEKNTWHDRFNAMESGIYATTLVSKEPGFFYREGGALRDALVRLVGNSRELVWQPGAAENFRATWDHRYMVVRKQWTLAHIYRQSDRFERDFRAVIAAQDGQRSDYISLHPHLARRYLYKVYLDRGEFVQAADVIEPMATGVDDPAWAVEGLWRYFALADASGDPAIEARAMKCALHLPKALSAEDRGRVMAMISARETGK